MSVAVDPRLEASRSTARSQRDRGPSPWWIYFLVLCTAGSAWILSTPLMTGPDEVSQVRRAAAVARGQWAGEAPADGSVALVLDVSVPEAYAEPADERWRCFLGPLVDGTPQAAMDLPAGECVEIEGGTALVTSPTVQYRGQPFFYGFVGLPTLVNQGALGAFGIRFLALLPAAAFLASAAVTVRSARSPSLAGVGLVLAVTPAVIYLASASNPSALEIAASLSAWAAGARLATDPDPVGNDAVALVRRLGLALTVLALTRGLSPAFVVVIVVALAACSSRQRLSALASRSDVRLWGVAVMAACAASGAWLLWVQSTYPLPDRPGSGLSATLDLIPWYLRQSVGVFGSNDSALPTDATTAWVLAAMATTIVGLGLATTRVRVVSSVLLVAGLALSVSAEGLSIPPIGFFWQGRYALPLLLGGVIVATTGAGTAPADRTKRWINNYAALLALGAVAIHLWAFLVVGVHHASQGGPPLSLSEALDDSAWSAPLPLFAGALAYGCAIGVWCLVLALPRPPLSPTTDTASR